MENGSFNVDVLRSVVQFAPHAIVMTDTEGKILLLNNQAELYFGYSPSEVLGQPVELLVPEQSKDSHKNYRTAYLQNPKPRPMGAGRELFAVRKDGSQFPIEIGLNPVQTTKGKFIIASIVDITERKRMERKFRHAVESAPNGIIITDKLGKITLANQQARNYFGYTQDELLGEKVEKLIPQRYQHSHPTYRKAFAGHPESRPMGIGRDLFAVRKDGSEFPVEIGLNPIETEDGLEVLVVIVDITQRKKNEEEQNKFQTQLQQTQKLESLGVLAGGIAHDFNNILTGVLGNADLAMLELSPVSSIRKFIKNIQSSSIHAAELCRQMLAYSGKGKFIIQPIIINQIVDDLDHLLKISISKTTLINYNLYEHLPPIDGDATQIRQVIMNLIINASEAIGKKSGVITITTGVAECDDDYLSDMYWSEKLSAGIYVFLEISDSGSGMDKETQHKIFDPFFTTKFTGRGLGLAAVLGIIRSHHGAIKVYSEPGHGTTFRILLPCSSNEIIAPSDEYHDIPEYKGEGKILIIDDEESVRAIARQSLEKIGFQVITAQDGVKGMEKFEQNMDEIALVLLDLTMPHMNGDEVFRRIHRMKPHMPVILTSGYHEQELTSRFAGRGLSDFIQKPLRPMILLSKVKKILSM